ncbi:hypothetical protein MMC17_005345 [Xylographa soralifera]|nr:hypothetical protein [Xylographa soralifera]
MIQFSGATLGAQQQSLGTLSREGYERVQRDKELVALMKELSHTRSYLQHMFDDAEHDAPEQYADMCGLENTAVNFRYRLIRRELRAETTAARLSLGNEPSPDPMLATYVASHSIVSRADHASPQPLPSCEASMYEDGASSASDLTIDDGTLITENASDLLEGTGLLAQDRLLDENDSSRTDLDDFIRQVNNVAFQEMKEHVAEGKQLED